MQVKNDIHNKTILAKHAGAAKATTHAWNVSPVFKNSKAYLNATTEKHSPDVGLKGIFTHTLIKPEIEGILFVDLKTQKALIDHMASFLDFFTRATHKKNTRNDLISNGMLDSETFTYPDMYSIKISAKEQLQKTKKIFVLKFFRCSLKLLTKITHAWFGIQGKSLPPLQPLGLFSLSSLRHQFNPLTRSHFTLPPLPQLVVILISFSSSASSFPLRNLDPL